MKTIWKYELPIQPRCIINTCEGCLVRKVGLDAAGIPSVWIEVDAGKRGYPLPLAVIGTGQEVPPEEFKYFDSFVRGEFVWHVYEYNP